MVIRLKAFLENGCHLLLVFHNQDSHDGTSAIMQTKAATKRRPKCLLSSHRLIDNHSGYRLSVLLLLWRIDAMSLRIHREAVHGVLNLEILDLAVVLRIVLMKHGNSSAVASYVDALQSGIKLDHIRAV